MVWVDLASEFSLHFETGGYIWSKDWVQHGFDTPRAWTEDLVPRSSMENLNVT